MDQVLEALLLAGLMGMIGQAIRAIAGLKKMNDDAGDKGVSSQDLFIASRLIISLIIGFVAGVIAASTMLAKVTAVTTGDISVLLGLAAAGYAGTDFIEALAPTIVGGVGNKVAPVAPVVQPAPVVPPGPGVAAQALSPGAGAANFGSLVPGGFYSADPNNLGVPRAIRTNNPGALNYSAWQAARKGFVEITQPDSAGNRTTIYRTPEHGTAAWYHLLARIYGYGSAPTFALSTLAQRYAGASSGPAVDAYITGWTTWSQGTISSTSSFNANDPSQMLLLAKAMFSHEAGKYTPLQDAQIIYGIQNEQAGTLPS